MIERIARAILTECERQQVESTMHPCVDRDSGWDETVVLDGSFDLATIAQAALEAMINLTPAMQDACEAMLDKEGMYMDPSISDVWETCIKAAIAER